MQALRHAGDVQLDEISLKSWRLFHFCTPRLTFQPKKKYSFDFIARKMSRVRKNFFYEFIFPVLGVFEGTLHFETFHDITIISRSALLVDKVQWKWWKFDKKNIKKINWNTLRKNYMYWVLFYDEFRYFFVMGFVGM